MCMCVYDKCVAYLCPKLWQATLVACPPLCIQRSQEKKVDIVDGCGLGGVCYHINTILVTT